MKFFAMLHIISLCLNP